jgi:hypothetical protein
VSLRGHHRDGRRLDRQPLHAPHTQALKLSEVRVRRVAVFLPRASHRRRRGDTAPGPRWNPHAASCQTRPLARPPLRFGIPEKWRVGQGPGPGSRTASLLRPTPDHRPATGLETRWSTLASFDLAPRSPVTYPNLRLRAPQPSRAPHIQGCSHTRDKVQTTVPNSPPPPRFAVKIELRQLLDATQPLSRVRIRRTDSRWSGESDAACGYETLHGNAPVRQRSAAISPIRRRSRLRFGCGGRGADRR